jgi:hypothetical protein
LGLVEETLRSGLLEARAESGRIVEGHADLRPAHVCLSQPPVIIDCWSSMIGHVWPRRHGTASRPDDPDKRGRFAPRVKTRFFDERSTRRASVSNVLMRS